MMAYVENGKGQLEAVPADASAALEGDLYADEDDKQEKKP
jgi:hypothetical protein